MPPEEGLQTGTGAQGGMSGAQGDQGGQQGDGQGETPTFESWLAQQDETIRGLLDGHVKGLKSALESERSQRGDLARQLREVTAKAEKGSELEKTLTDMTARVDAAEGRAAFYEEAGRPEVGCANSKAAFALAQAEGLFDTRGNVDWAALKTTAPELFRVKAPEGNADGGTSNPPPGKTSMDDLIRARAGDTIVGGRPWPTTA